MLASSELGFDMKGSPQKSRKGVSDEVESGASVISDDKDAVQVEREALIATISPATTPISDNPKCL